MPQIPVYDANIVGNGIKNVDNPDIGAPIAKGVRELGQGIEQGAEKAYQGYLTFQDRKQMSDGMAAYSKWKAAAQTGIANQTESFNPEDPDAQDTYMKTLNDQRDQILNGVDSPQAREYLSKRFDLTSDTLWQQALHKNAMLQSKEIGDNVHTVTQQLSSTAYQNPDYGLQSMNDDVKSFQDSLPPNIGQGTKDQLGYEMKRAVAMSAAKGEIYADPNKASENLASGKYDAYLTGDDISSLSNHADQMSNARQRQAELNQTLQQRQVTKQQNANYQNAYMGVYSGDTTYPAIVNALSEGAITPQHFANLETAMKNAKTGTDNGDPSAAMDAWHKLSLPDGDPNKITDFNQLSSQYNTGKGNGLGQRDLQSMSAVFLANDGSTTPKAGFANLVQASSKQLINPTAIPWGDRMGMVQFSSFMNHAHASYQAGKAAGLTDDQMLNPQSKDYIGKDIQQFKLTPEQRSGQARAGSFYNATPGALSSPPSAASGQTATTQAPPPVPTSPQVSALLDKLSASIPDKSGGK